MALYCVRYKGASDVRIIHASDAGLKARGIKLDQKLQWDASNLWKQYVDGMSEELEQLFRDEGTFLVEEVDDKSGVPKKEIVTATRWNDTTGVVRDGTTGQVSKPKG